MITNPLVLMRHLKKSVNARVVYVTRKKPTKECTEFPLRNSASIYLVAVSKKARRVGLSALLYKRIEEVCREKGFKMIISNVYDGNRASVEMHKKSGFEVVCYTKSGAMFAKKIDTRNRGENKV